MIAAPPATIPGTAGIGQAFPELSHLFYFVRTIFEER